MARRARLIAFHLPQFHPIPENDEWWGNGFTEWTNATRATPLFRGHYQPHLPRDLGFYDLRLAESRAAQASLADKYGIEGFCYYHYWFAGRRLLERPVNAILESGEPHFPFCLCWANESWTGIWHGAPHRTLVEQTYPGDADHQAHFKFLLRAFRDPRYITIDEKPLLAIYRPWEVPQTGAFVELWRDLARSAGLRGLFLVAIRGANRGWDAISNGFDATVTPRIPPRRPWVSWRNPWRKACVKWEELRGLPTIYSYAQILDDMLCREDHHLDFPCVVPNWDNTPRSGRNGLVLQGSTPELFRSHVRAAMQMLVDRPEQQRLIFIKSWNEWAEGNYLEPDLQFGSQYLEVLGDETT
ncbi:MAG: glycosyltransferase WbsX family protein [Casimicrobiaceae bacterium]